MSLFYIFKKSLELIIVLIILFLLSYGLYCRFSFNRPGNFLITTMVGVYEIDRHGRIIWFTGGFKNIGILIYRAQRLSNGYTVLSGVAEPISLKDTGLYYPYNSVVVDRSGRVVRGYNYDYRSYFSYIDAVKMLPNGNMLLGGILLKNNFEFLKIIELNRAGKVLWQYNLRDSVNMALSPYNEGWFIIGSVLGFDRLSNGNTIITRHLNDTIFFSDSGIFDIIEVTPSGKVVWSYPLMAEREKLFLGISAHRLTNGNTLIPDVHNRKVLEVNKPGQIIWEYVLPGKSFPFSAFRLHNGNTLIYGNNIFIEVTPEKKFVWKHYFKYRGEGLFLYINQLPVEVNINVIYPLSLIVKNLFSKSLFVSGLPTEISPIE